MILVNGYALATAAGDSVADLWSDLTKPADESRRELLFKGTRPSTVRQLLGDKLMHCYRSVPRPEGRYGVILASTKGMSDDFVWSEEFTSGRDPLVPILEDFLKSSGLNPDRSLCVSNACSSTLAAIRLAQIWLNRDLDEVLILAADAVTPFVKKGFQSLHLISRDYPRPFAGGRSGFFLGEAAACILLSKKITQTSVRILPVGLDTEGSAVTRPGSSSESLFRACTRIPGIPRARAVDLVIAHGTGTPVNDETEDLAFSALFRELPYSPYLTGSKWRVGHTLGASGAVDVILGCEALKRNQSFCLETTPAPDPKFKCRYLTPGHKTGIIHRVLVSSLGFGGMHAAAVLEPAEVMA